jgi:type IV pilus assembly protein PilM
MSLLDSLPTLFRDPPPAYVFEVSEAGIAFAASNRGTDVQFHEFEPGIVSVSPAHDNVQQPEIFAAHVSALVPTNGNKKRRSAALILPDHSARVQVLDFDSFPSTPDEQRALVRFRVKKSVPFDVDSAAVSYHVQPAAGKGKIEVVAAVASLEIVARYEAAFRAAGYQPGLVTTSSVAALNLVPAQGTVVLAKLSGKVLSVVVLEASRVKLVRTVELESVTSDNVLSILHPTLAYVEDQLSVKTDQLLVCGFGSSTFVWLGEWQSELGVPVEGLQSKAGAPGPYNAGLLGYLEVSGVLQ